MKKEMLINVLQPEECRIAIVEDGVLEELYVERTSQESYVNNIYKGKIVNIEPSIQAAFVDFGIGRNGFLHVSDVASAYFRPSGERQDRGRRDDREDRGGRGRGGGPRQVEAGEIPSGPDVVNEPADFVEVEPVTEEVVSEEYDEFGAGLLDEGAADSGNAARADVIDRDVTDASPEMASD